MFSINPKLGVDIVIKFESFLPAFLIMAALTLIGVSEMLGLDLFKVVVVLVTAQTSLLQARKFEMLFFGGQRCFSRLNVTLKAFQFLVLATKRISGDGMIKVCNGPLGLGVAGGAFSILEFFREIGFVLVLVAGQTLGPIEILPFVNTEFFVRL